MWYEENQLAKKEEIRKCKEDPCYFFENYVVKKDKETGKYVKPSTYEIKYMKAISQGVRRKRSSHIALHDEAYIPGMTAEDYKDLWNEAIPSTRKVKVGTTIYTGINTNQ